MNKPFSIYKLYTPPVYGTDEDIEYTMCITNTFGRILYIKTPGQTTYIKNPYSGVQNIKMYRSIFVKDITQNELFVELL